MVGKSIPLKQWKTTSLDLKGLKVILVYRPSPKKSRMEQLYWPRVSNCGIGCKY
jgi:hypothetical protein